MKAISSLSTLLFCTCISTTALVHAYNPTQDPYGKDKTEEIDLLNITSDVEIDLQCFAITLTPNPRQKCEPMLKNNGLIQAAISRKPFSI